MALLTWSATYSVEEEEMDRQHQRLFDLINEFYDNIGKQSSKELILTLIAGMKDYTIVHFTDEEALMKKHGYPALEQHQKEHAAFVAKVLEVEEKVNSGKMVISFEITNFLKDWIKNHIQKSDQKYTEYFLKQGIIG